MDVAHGTLVRFKARFSEAVTGFEASDVALTGSAKPTTATVTGSGKSYVVEVSGMSKSGSVIATVKANAAQDGSGNLSKASTIKKP